MTLLYMKFNYSFHSMGTYFKTLKTVFWIREPLFVASAPLAASHQHLSPSPRHGKLELARLRTVFHSNLLQKYPGRESRIDITVS